MFKYLLSLYVLQWVYQFTNGKDYTYLDRTQSFYKVHTTSRTWEDAKYVCSTENATLFYPNDEAEANNIISFLNETLNWFFIGVSAPYAKQVFTTVDGMPIIRVYDKWRPGEPNDAGGVEDCVVLSTDGLLNDDDCQKKLPFICKKTSSLQWNRNFNVSDLDAQQKFKFFRKDYTYLDGLQSFYKVHRHSRTWDDAKYVCSMEGATLFYPNDEAEANNIISFLNETLNWFFIGVSAPYAKQVFETIDGIPIISVYDKWRQGEPNDAGGVEDCVVLSTDGLLSDDDCQKKLPFICKKPLSTLQWNKFCNVPDVAYEYVETLGKCYKFHSTPKSWTEAYTVCNTEQSYLAVINSQEEADYFSELTNKINKVQEKSERQKNAVHLGNRLRNNKWYTIKNMPVEDSGYIKWEEGQPDGKGEEKCGSMSYNGLLLDINCDQRLSFICEHEVLFLLQKN